MEGKIKIELHVNEIREIAEAAQYCELQCYMWWENHGDFEEVSQMLGIMILKNDSGF